jgi:cytochrome P450
MNTISTAFEKGEMIMNETSQTCSLPQNPYPYYQHMREQQPVFYHQEQEVWQVFRYADVERVFTDYQTFSSRTPCCSFTTDFHSFYRMDPPELQQYRGLVSQPFTPLAVAQLTDRMRDMVAALLDRIADRGQMDVMADLAFPFPLRVMADLLGLPLQDEERYAAWSQAINGEEMPELRAYFHELLTERQCLLRPGLITSLLEARLDGRPLHQEEVLGHCGQLFAGANVEITPFLGNVVQSLLEHPEVAEELRAEPDLIPSAIEEMLRVYPPVPTGGPRRVTTDVELSGQVIRAGQRIIPVLASANQDETMFAEPDRFDMRRQPNPHLSFVTGPHVCIGAHLSRLETRIVLSALLERFQDIQAASGARLSPAGMFGVKHLPITFRTRVDPTLTSRT